MASVVIKTRGNKMSYIIQTNLNPMDGDNWIYNDNDREFSIKQEAIDTMNEEYDVGDARVVKIHSVTGQIIQEEK